MQQRPVMPIFFATDDGYAPALGVALASMLDNVSDGYDLRIHILTTGLSPENTAALRETVGERATLAFVDMKERIAELEGRLALRNYYSSATYLRLFIAEMFPEYDKALYLDCDIVINGDVSELFEAPIGNDLVAAVPEDVMARIDLFGRYVEVCLDIPRAEYFNAGILTMNLAAFRAEHILERFVALLSRRRYVVTQDQDYLNVLCRGKVTFLPDTWNTSPLETKDVGVPALVHYKLDRKPWHYRDVRFGEYFWQYAKKTPYFAALEQICDSFGEEGIERDRASYASLVKLAEREIADEPALRATKVRRRLTHRETMRARTSA